MMSRELAAMHMHTYTVHNPVHDRIIADNQHNERQGKDKERKRTDGVCMKMS